VIPREGVERIAIFEDCILIRMVIPREGVERGIRLERWHRLRLVHVIPREGVERREPITVLDVYGLEGVIPREGVESSRHRQHLFDRRDRAQ